MTKVTVWFDIPVQQLERAMKFYQEVTGMSMTQMDGYTGMAMFPQEDSQATGCLYETTETKPSAEGILVYFNANGRLSEAIAAVEPNGGKVLETKHQIGPHGFRALVLDSEGNRIALHSESDS